MSSTASTPYHTHKSEGTIHCSVCLQHCHLLGNLSFSLDTCPTNHTGVAALLWAGKFIYSHRAAAPQFPTCSHRRLRGPIDYRVHSANTSKLERLKEADCMSFHMLKWGLFSLLENVNTNDVLKNSGNRLKKQRIMIFFPLLVHKYSDFFTFFLFLRYPQDSIQCAKHKD